MAQNLLSLSIFVILLLPEMNLIILVPHVYNSFTESSLSHIQPKLHRLNFLRKGMFIGIMI